MKYKLQVSARETLETGNQSLAPKPREDVSRSQSPPANIGNIYWLSKRAAIYTAAQPFLSLPVKVHVMTPLQPVFSAHLEWINFLKTCQPHAPAKHKHWW
jgi:hypothetical protein